jgi:hypothetical protein
MPPEWSCKKASSSTAAALTSNEDSENDDDDGNDADNSPHNEHVQEMADLLALQKRFGETEASGLRRSSRETRPAPGRRSNRDKKKDTSKKTEGLEYYLMDTISGNGAGEKGIGETTSLSSIPSSRLDVEILLEKRHEHHYAKLYKSYEGYLSPVGNSATEDEDNNNDNGNNFALYSSGSFPPYLGKVIPSKNNHGYSWEIRPPFVIPALRWVLRGLIASGHMTAIEPMFGGSITSGIVSGNNQDISAGVVLCNDVYYWNPKICVPFQVLDTRVLQRKKRAGIDGEHDSSEDEVEMSEYEKLRAERVARNAERLKALGLA